MNPIAQTREQLTDEVADLRVGLAEANDTLRAIRNGEVDAVLVHGPQGEQLFTLKSADEPYRVLIEEMNQGAVTLSADGLILYCNRRFADLVKRQLEEIVGLAFVGFVAPSERAGFAVLLEAGRIGASAGEITLSAVDASAVPLQLALGPLPAESAAAICLIATDISESKRVEEALRASEAQLQTVVENLEEGVIVSDLDGRLLQWNRAALKLHGYSDSDQDRRRFTELIDTFELSTLDGVPVSVEEWPIARILRGEKVQDLELRVQRIGCDWQRIFHYGGTLVHDATNQPLMAIVTVDDITERKRADNQLRTSLREVSDLKAALDEHAIVAITDPRGKITYVNDKFCAISKYSREELVGQDHRIINSGYHSKQFIGDLWATIRGSAVWRGEIKNRAKDDSYYWVDTTIVPFLNEEGKPRQYVAVRTDITARKRAEDEIRQLNVELEERVKQRTADLESANKELEAFSYSVSHDLRAPLRHVAGFVELLREDAAPSLSEKSVRYLATISQSAKRMGDLIDDLLAFSRVGRSELQKNDIDLDELVRQTLSELQVGTNGRKINWDARPLPAVRADRSMLRLVLVNLISNALKFTSTRIQAKIEIGCAFEDDKETTIFVRDNGVGFDPKYAGKLFGVFQRLHSKEEFEGTGIGLANVQRIIHRHGGRVWAEGAVDKGATFYFSIPK
jgi:PAS domain S-box-containing protein